MAIELIPKIEDGVWGFVTGDAVGLPHEFKDRNSMLNLPCSGMHGYGTHMQPPGTWSDDSSMMLCVLENIKKKGNIHSLAMLFIDWYLNGHNSANNEVFDIGITTRISLQRVINGVHPHKSGCNDEFSRGNGSLMRCLPYAFMKDFSKSVFKMVMQNKITHSAALCNLCCMFYCKMIRCLADGMDNRAAYRAAIAYLRFGWRITDENSETDENKNSFQILFSTSFADLPEHKIKSSGYVIRTLEAAVWCFLNSSNYPEAVLKAVNLGGDTDTIAALTGGLAGVYYGKENIPEEWIEKIVNKHLIDEILNK